MICYVVSECRAYEGGDDIAVFGSLSAAKQYAEQQAQNHEPGIAYWWDDQSDDENSFLLPPHGYRPYSYTSWRVRAHPLHQETSG